MYFDLGPKQRREDLFDFDDQFNTLLGLLRGRRARAPLIMVTGSRRVGKTSLVQTALNESGLPNLTLSGAPFADMPTIKRQNLLRVLELELNETVEKEKRWGEKFLDVLSGVRWLKVNSKPPFIHFEWERPVRELDLLDLIYSFKRLARQNKTRFVFVIDEAQEIQMIVTGSQIGFLHDFLELDNPNAPLYGRGTVDIHAPKIGPIAADFLARGFEQAKITPAAGVVDLAVKKLDGIIGWLTFFGSRSVERGGPTEDALNEAVERGSKLAASEFENFLKVRPAARKRYARIMGTAARLECTGWTALKQDLEIHERKRVANNVFSDLVENLCKGDFLSKGEDGTYSVSDPLFAHAIKKGVKPQQA
jgi:hypothetical protein